MDFQSFTALELYCLAYLCGKTKMYGIPDPLSQLADEQKSETLDSTITSFIDRGILVMDFDGNQALQQEYEMLVSVFCDCDKCLIVNIANPGKEEKNLVVWKTNQSVFFAEKVDDVYSLSTVQEYTIRSIFNPFFSELCDGESSIESTVLNLSLIKASRAAEKGDLQAALRILKQDGVCDSIAGVVIDGMQKKAMYLGCLLIEIDKEHGNSEKSSAFLCSRNRMLHLTQRYRNLRNCTSFGSISKEDAIKEVNGILDVFFV